jgi:glycosyltransferase involved in cell wall biosynthesis
VALDVFPLRRFASGTEEYIEALATALLHRGTPLTAVGGPAPTLEPGRPHLGLPERSRPSPWAKWQWEQRGLVGAARRTGADVLHIPYMAHPPVPCAVPTVVTIHDVIPFTFPGYGGRLRDRLYFRGLPARLDHATHLVAVSEATRDAVADVFPDWIPRLSVIPNGIDEAFFEPPLPEAQEEAARLLGFQPDAGPPLILYVGNYQPHKNVGVLMRAMRDLRPDDARLVLTGSAGDAEVDAMVTELGVAERVIRLPRVGRPVLRALYAVAHVFAYPSKMEGFGLPPAQALAAGVPAAVSDAAAVVEVVGDAARVSPADDAAAWTSTLHELLTLSGAERAQVVDGGRRRAEAFHWDVAAARYQDLYREATS